VQAGFPAVMELSSLAGSSGFRIDGVAAGDRSGVSTSGAGDFNGDGIGDLIIGAFEAGSGGSFSGTSYVVFGNSSFGSSLELGSLNGSNGFLIAGSSIFDLSGRSVNAAGDVNGDGTEDAIISAYLADPNGTTDAGSSYVVFGNSSPAPSLGLGLLNGGDGFRLAGAATGDHSGNSVSAAGDFNGDGLGDVIIGAPLADFNGTESGSSYIVFGRNSFGSSLDLSSLNGSNGFRLDGLAAYDESGYSVSRAGDINGDGVDDVIIGGYKADANGNIDSGSCYVVFGSSSGFASALQLNTLNGSNGFRLNGVAAGDHAGVSVSAAGDVNGDGLSDIIIGALLADSNGTDSGSGYVVFGSTTFGPTLDLSALNGSNGFRLNGVAAGDGAGVSVSAAGDINGDGLSDVIVGAFLADSNGTDSGSSYIVFGRSNFGSSLELSALNGGNGFRLNGVATGDHSGNSVSDVGDVNGDGLGDVIIGAIRADPNGASSGSSYVVFGQRAAAATGPAKPVPTLSVWGLLASGLLTLLITLWRSRRR